MYTGCYSRQACTVYMVVTALIFSLHPLYTARASAQEVTCEVPSVEPLTNTSVTCHFPENVSQTRTVSVTMYKERIQDEKEILDCWWLEGKLGCAVSSGYKFNRIISRELTLEIPRVYAEHIGRYACKLSNMDPNLIKSCELKIKQVGKTMCDIPSVKQTSQMSLTCYFPEDLSKTRAGLIVHHYSSRGYTDPVLSCRWKGDTLICATVRGYEFDQSLTDHATLRIPSASKEQEGTYSCQITGLGSIRSENCSFKLENAAANSSCSIPSVQEMESTTLTCRFSVDINVTKRDFTVVHLVGDSENGTGVLICSWRNNLLSCAIAAGYEFNNTVTDHLVIGVLRASRDHNGTYACHVMGSQIEEFKSCEFIVTKVSGELTHTPVATNVWMVVAIVAVIIFLIVGIFIFLLWQKRCNFTGTFKRKSKCQNKIPRTEVKISEDIPLLKTAEGSISEEGETFRLQWVEAAFPDLDSRAYFLPPVYFNRVPMTRLSVAGQDVLVLKSPPVPAFQSTKSALCSRAFTHFTTPRSYESYLREDEAMQRVFFCLKEFFEKNANSLVGLIHFRWNQTDLDVFLIHRDYGLFICVVNAFSESLQKPTMLQRDIYKDVRKKLQQAMSQLNSAENTLSTTAPGLRIIKMIAFPNLRADQVNQIITDDSQMSQELCRCLGIKDAVDIAGLCLCSDHLSDPETPWDVSSQVLKELGHWWQRRVAGAGPDSHMSPDIYKSLVVRFCGPVTTVTVPWMYPPRVSVKTLGQAVWCTGECYTAVITLFPEQLHLLNTTAHNVFISGPPGTGKTVMLLLKGIKWLRDADVYILSSWPRSRAACFMLYHLMLKKINTQLPARMIQGGLHLLQYDFSQDVEKAVNDLSQVARGKSLYVIADEVGPDDDNRSDFQTFCKKMLIQVPELHLWAASCFQQLKPEGWQVEDLTRPIRSPPAVVREVQQDKHITNGDVLQYSERGVPDHTDGPPVKRLSHEGQGHAGHCVTCGGEVAKFLHSLRVGVQENITSSNISTNIFGSTPPCLQWRDVLVLYDWHGASDTSGMVKGLREAGIPVRVMKDDDMEDVATARSDVVWVTVGHRVRGLERKVVVCVEGDDGLHGMSRCTSQLVIVTHS